MNDKLFHLQQDIALHLIALLENKKISIKRAAEVANQVLNIIPEESGADMVFDRIASQLENISELRSLDFNQQK